MEGTGVPLATPFASDGSLSEDDLRAVVDWVEDAVDFLVPCGSTGEAPLMGPEERARVVRIVAEETDLPVLAGTGHAGYHQTLRSTERAAEAGADAALVVTPYYYAHSSEDLAAYYRDLATESPLPVYLYSVPKFTGVALDPDTVAELAGHDGVAGIKDSSGDVERIGRTVRATADREFAVLNGAGGVYAHALDAGADGGILALANVAPDRASEVYDLHVGGHHESARELNASLVPLNRAITARYGVPGVKAALRHRGVPVGRAREPFGPLAPEDREEIQRLVDDAT